MTYVERAAARLARELSDDQPAARVAPELLADPPAESEMVDGRLLTADGQLLVPAGRLLLRTAVYAQRGATARWSTACCWHPPGHWPGIGRPPKVWLNWRWRPACDASTSSSGETWSIPRRADRSSTRARIAQRWAAAGLDVVVHASRAPGAPRDGSYDGYRVRRPAGRYAVFPRVAARIVERGGSRPDGVVEVWNGMPFLSPLWARCPRMVFIHHVHDGMWDLVLPAPLARIGRGMERRVAPPLYRTTPVVTLSESSRRSIIDLLRLPPAAVSVVPPGIDDRFSPGGSRSEVPLVVAVGRLVGYKQFDVLVEVLARLRHRVPGLRAVIAGEGGERDRLQDRIAQLGAASWLELAGRVSDDGLVDLYRRAWVLASTSAFEGWGMTITEAAACATPAVVTRIPGHLDAVVDDHSGLLADSPAQMEDGLAAVLTDGALRRRLGTGAVQRARSLTWDRTALDTLRVLAADARRRAAS